MKPDQQVHLPQGHRGLTQMTLSEWKLAASRRLIWVYCLTWKRMPLRWSALVKALASRSLCHSLSMWWSILDHSERRQWHTAGRLLRQQRPTLCATVVVRRPMIDLCQIVLWDYAARMKSLVKKKQKVEKIRLC